MYTIKEINKKKTHNSTLYMKYIAIFKSMIPLSPNVCYFISSSTRRMILRSYTFEDRKGEESSE